LEIVANVKKKMALGQVRAQISKNVLTKKQKETVVPSLSMTGGL